MKSRCIAIGLILCIILGMYGAASVMAKEPQGTGKYGKDIAWTVYDDKSIVFSGNGATKDGGFHFVQNWYVYNDQLEQVVFEDGITYIGEYTFYGSNRLYQHIKTVTLPASVEKIGAYAFYLSNLEALHISSLEKYCQIEFANSCHPLGCKADLYLNGQRVEDLEIPQTVTQIKNYAFYGCTSIRNVTVPNSVTQIGDFAFNSCANLETIIFSGKAPEFGESVFVLSKVTAYYPANDPSWNEVIKQDFGGAVTWVPSQCNGGHTEQIDVAVASSCNQTGLTEGKSCSSCGTVLIPQEIIPMTEHTYESTVTAPRCDWHGFTTHTCTGCGHSYETDRVELLGHDFSGWEIVEQPGPDHAGRESRECSRCGLIEGRALNPSDVTQPTEPVTEPVTQPATQPTEPSTEPSTEAVTQPTEAVTWPTEQAEPVQNQQSSTFSKVLWLIVVGPSVLIGIVAVIAIRVWKHRVWVKYLQDEFGDGDEEE